MGDINSERQVDEQWRDKEYSFFSHKRCEAFPCHKTESEDDFNCLFCYCPLYVLGRDCGGRFKYLSNGVKDCSGCVIPHNRESFGYIAARFDDIKQLVKKLS